MSSLTDAEAVEAVYTQWKSVWESLHDPTDSNDTTYVPYTYENRLFEEPPLDVSWAHISVKQIESNQDVIGSPSSREFRRDAQVWVRLHLPLTGGVAKANALVDDVRTVFEGKRFGGVSGIGGVRQQSLGSNGRFYEVVAIAPIMYYERH